jgi:hypothetical protein
MTPQDRRKMKRSKEKEGGRSDKIAICLVDSSHLAWGKGGNWGMRERLDVLT